MHFFLFLLTIITTVIAGAMQQGVDPLESPDKLWIGIPFSFTLLIILGAHEFGHYFMSRRYGADVTLPYFIPAPSFIGTFGAFIKIRSPMRDRRMLLDIGAAGPVAGLVVAIPVTAVGLLMSDIKLSESIQGTPLGSSILFSLISWIVLGNLPQGTDIVLHPIAFSGWIGILVTAFNLMPLGQLDGGHIAYAIWGERQRDVARIMFLVLLLLGLLAWSGWLFWALIVYLMGLYHPPSVCDWIHLDARRRFIGRAMMVIFFLTFTPVPF